MAKLFIFGIGGTGARVLKSLSMLLASGVSLGKEIDEVVPIIIDVDRGNEDLTRTIQILQCYNKLNQLSSGDNPNYEGFYQTRIKNLFDIKGNEFRMQIQDVQGKTFGQYIDHSTLTGANRDMAELLFSGTQNHNGIPEPLLKMDMKEGFQGNPKLGCVVLNQFVGNNDFNTFANNFSQGDRIFIISSIYGGTGAAGFPLLLKNLRGAQPPVPNSNYISNATIGAVTVLPYFKLLNGDIKSEDFISKTKAALEYYEKNVNPALNSLYYIGYDGNTNNYENHRGGPEQRNDAHFVELAAAMSVIDFANQNEGVLPLGERYLEFGTNDFSNEIDFSILGSSTNSMIKSPMMKFHFFKSFIAEQLKKSILMQPWGLRGKVKLNKELQTGDYYNAIKEFNGHYQEWLDEMARNYPSFKPFSQNSPLMNSINSCQASTSRWETNYSLFDDLLNKAERQVGDTSKERKFIEIFNQATTDLTKKFQ